MPTPASQDFCEAMRLLGEAEMTRRSSRAFLRAGNWTDGDELALEAELMCYQAMKLVLGSVGADPAQQR